MGIFNKPIREIKSAKLLGVREAHETTVFATVNFTMYSFWVEYTNGTSELVECSPSDPHGSRNEKKLFEQLMAAANAAERRNLDKAPVISNGSILDELQKLKELHDAGVIPDELYNEKKDALVKQLAVSPQNEDATQISNLTILRANKRPVGEAKTSVFLDGIQLDANLDDSLSRKLDIGGHQIYFERGFVTSKKISISVETGKKYKIIVNPKVFSIEVQVIEE